MTTHVTNLYRMLPQLGEYLESPHGVELLACHPRPMVVEAARAVLDHLRQQIVDAALTEASLQAELSRLHERIAAHLADGQRSSLQPVINATGVILQTNLGRAPLSEAAIARILEVAAGYCNLEYDLETGGRGRRGASIEELLLKTLDCDPHTHAALIVNNCAAATFLTLNALAEGGEVIVSRGELVEIGGGFRVPDILRKSGARLVEVGTTNRTRIQDYAQAITPDTRLLLRVHRSNFEMTGFTQQPTLEELAGLSKKAGIPLFEDQGTGCMVDLAAYGIPHQSSFARSAQSGASIVSASGDKLFGGPQCGLIVGHADLLQTLRTNPLYRAFRVDKLTCAGLQATLIAYLTGDADSIPTLRMLRESPDTIRQRCQQYVDALASSCLLAEVVESESVVGGGTTPGATVPSFAVALRLPGIGADLLAAQLRRLSTPVIARIRDDRVLLDLRTVPASFDTKLLPNLKEELLQNIEPLRSTRASA